MKNNKITPILIRGTLLALIVPVWMLMLSTSCDGSQPTTAVVVLENSRFKKDVRIKNTKNIYLNIIELMENRELVNNPLTGGIKVHEIGFAWMVVMPATEIPLEFEIKKDSSVLDLLHQVALSRNELLVERYGGIVAMPIQSQIVRLSYETVPNSPDIPTCELKELFMPKEVRLLGKNSLEMERLFESNIAATNDLIKGASPVSATLKIEEAAKPAIERVNVIGSWTYHAFLDVTCALAGLRWHIDGNRFVITASQLR